ncbi:MAG: CRISPR-associated endonuclease Cas2 [Nitrospinota bacterium]
MFYVVAYDIPDDKRRNRLFKAMKGFGIHTQFSLFECTLDDKEFIRMTKKIESVMDKKEDDIKIYPICNSCLQKVESHGKAVLNKEKEVIVI